MAGVLQDAGTHGGCLTDAGTHDGCLTRCRNSWQVSYKMQELTAGVLQDA